MRSKKKNKKVLKTKKSNLNNHPVLYPSMLETQVMGHFYPPLQRAASRRVYQKKKMNDPYYTAKPVYLRIVVIYIILTHHDNRLCYSRKTPNDMTCALKCMIF